MVADCTLTLGDFTFATTEIPEEIPLGGGQDLVIHKLVGGIKVIDAMGPDDMPLAWSGLFFGENALDRALYLDGLRKAGQELTLVFHRMSYRVIIDRFEFPFQRYYKLPYRISCTVVADETYPVTEIARGGIDDAMAADMFEANRLGGLIGDGPLSDLLGVLDSAILTVSDFARATQSVVNSVLTPIAAVKARVDILIGQTGNLIGNVSTLGGILPNTPIAQQAARLVGQAGAMTQLPSLYNLNSVLGRMGTNLGSIGSGGQSVSMAGGNLYTLAQQAYGDMTAWTGIARANGLTDPLISGLATLKVPTVPDSNDGVMTT